jgi:DNA-binding Lrp family transcriptional regulator
MLKKNQEFSKIDKKIILELQKNGRASYTELSSAIGINVSTAASRTEKLIQSRSIEVRAIPNPLKIGLSANAVIVIQADPSKIDFICEQFIDSFNIATLLTVFGRYDVLLFVSFPTWELMHDFINGTLSKVEGILKIETFFLKNFVKRYEDIFGNIPHKIEQVKLSEIEWKLIVELTKNGRMSLNEISGKIGVHVSTISRKLHALLEQEVIKIIAIPNPFKFGYYSNAFMVLEVEATKVDRICKKLYAHPEIIVITTLISGSGIIIGIQSWNNETLYKFIKEKIAQINGVMKIETFLTAELKKRFYGWLVKEKDLSV